MVGTGGGFFDFVPEMLGGCSESAECVLSCFLLEVREVKLRGVTSATAPAFRFVAL